MPQTIQGLRQRGSALLRSIMGGKYVDARIAGTGAFNRPLRNLIDTYCFGEVWADPTLTPKQRSMIVVSMLAAMGRQTELSVHVGGALNNGCTPEELREIFLHVGVYCGVPAANDATRIAMAVLDERGLLDAVQERAIPS